MGTRTTPTSFHVLNPAYSSQETRNKECIACRFVSVTRPATNPQRSVRPYCIARCMCVEKRRLLLWRVPKAPKTCFGDLRWDEKTLACNKVHTIFGESWASGLKYTELVSWRGDVGEGGIGSSIWQFSSEEALWRTAAPYLADQLPLWMPWLHFVEDLILFLITEWIWSGNRESLGASNWRFFWSGKTLSISRQITYVWGEF